MSGATTDVGISSFWLRAGHLFFVARIPDRTTLEDAFRDSQPFSDLAVVGTHPVHGNWSETSLLTVAGETEPASAVLRGDGSAASGIGPSIAEDPLLDQKDGVFDWRSTLHFTPLDGRWVDHPDFPHSSARVQKRSIAGIFCSLYLHLSFRVVTGLSNAKAKPGISASVPRASTFVRRDPPPAPSRRPDSFPPVFLIPTRRSTFRRSPSRRRRHLRRA